MNISRPFIFRPVGTTLMVVAIALAGILAYLLLPVSPLPSVDYPVISVSANLPGASPDTMASSVATPLERQLGKIAGITEMTSSSSLGSANVTIQFALNRDINAAARDVQAAINAAASQLPANLPSKPTYRKVNPSDAPILILELTSNTYDRGKMYDIASSILAQKLAQVDGVGQVTVGGGALPAVRVELNPTRLNSMGLAMDDVRTALAAANANRPKGELSDDYRTWTLATTDQLHQASEYRPLIIAYRNGSPIRLADIADVTDSVEDVRTGGFFNGKPAISVVISRQPGANIIDTVDRILALKPQLEASIPPSIKMDIGMDRTTTIRASVHDVEINLLLSIFLVVLVVFLFLRDFRTTLIPSVVVPISLLGTFGVMYLLGYSLDNLSLMALTVATGFVVDDAIVVIENITRYLEQGMKPVDAALKGASEIGFTVMSISISLVAVFLPILLMAGYVGRLFREFAVTLSVAVIVSMVISLTATPMMCALLLRDRRHEKHGMFYRASEWVFNVVHKVYERSLAVVLRHPLVTLLVAISTIGVTVWLFLIVPQTLFPVQDTGRITGNLVADQDISSEAMTRLTKTYAAILGADPAVDAVISFNGGRGTANTATMFITLKPHNIRKMSSEQVIARLRPKLSGIAGGILRLTSVQDVRAGGRQSNGGLYQYALQGDTLGELSQWAPKVMEKVRTLPGIVDLNSDQQTHGIQAVLQIDRATAARMDVSTQAVDDALYDAFGQRQVSTMYASLNQYHVVMEAAPGFTAGPLDLNHIYVRTASGVPIPLSTMAQYTETSTSLSIPHQSQFPCITLSFNLKVGTSLSDAVREITEAEQQMGVPATIHGSFAGTAQVFQESSASLPYLIIAAIVAVYIVLGMLYESFIHPITILSTLPSAGVGALLALLLFHIDLSIIAFIGILLLIGIVKKNAIMMIDFAIAAERNEGKSPRDAIFQAAVLRFRPITMTTMAAMLGGLPLAIGAGVGGEMRQPLGITIVGGLLFSQALTLYTTPVIYLYLDRVRLALGEFPLWLAQHTQRFWDRHRRQPAFVMLLMAGLMCVATGALASCKVSPDYARPKLDMPATYKSATTQDAADQAAHLVKNWWVLFQDPDLNQLEEDALHYNPDLTAALARVAQARAAAKQVKSQFYPQITLDPSIAVQYSGKTGVTSPTRIPFDLGYEIDLWGQVARSLESADAAARATADQFAVVMQTLEGDIAQNYINLRALEAQEEILTENVKLTQEQLDLIKRKQQVGIVGQIDVAQAQTQIDELKTQQIDIMRQRADLEHALAILTGKAPSEFSVESKPRVLAAPNIPPGLPADLLRQRPDLAAAEQNLVAANAQIGVALADFYPAVRLTGVAGFESVDVQHIFDWQSALLSLGPSVSIPIFEGGRLEGALDQSKARYEELRATYRSTLLAAFRDVEVSLTDVHLRSDALAAQHRAVESAREYLRLSRLEYDQGLVSYLQLLDADRTLLSNEQTESQLLADRLVSTVLLIKALGGGWNPDAPTQWPSELSQRISAP